MVKKHKFTNFQVGLTIALAIIYMSLLGSNPQANHYRYLAQAKLTSCNGIDDYFSNTSFDTDAELLLYDSGRCAKKAKEQNLTEIDAIGILYSPSDLRNCTGKTIDCEDISFFITCLAERYNIDCELDSYVGVNRVGHIGVKCKTDGEWKRYY